ncbi:hypothetical protein [Rhodoblastus sp.]|uniref:hypothetical protein n=1 Tax=Rhodoblastus sp. TaxID=1962975 RepID=UPI003F9BD0D8
MPPKTGFSSASELRALVRKSPAGHDKAQGGVRPGPPPSRFRFDAEWIVRLARRPDRVLRRRLAEEIATLRELGEHLAGRLAPAPPAKKWSAVFRKPAAPSAEIAAVGDSGGLPSALARAEAELQARRGKARKDAPDETHDAIWAARLAEEYRREFHPVTAARTEAPAEEKPTAADGAAAAAFGAGKLFWRVGLFFWPLFGFILARSAPILKLAAVGMAILAAAGFLAQWPRPASIAPVVKAPGVASSAPRRAGWAKIVDPFRFYDLPAPLVAEEKLVYEARRHETGGGREDFLNYGEFAGAAPFVRLAVYRHGSEKMSAAPFYVEMARRAAAIDISIDRADPPAMQATRFGAFETAALSMRKGRAARDNCRGFRFSATPPGVTIAGFACGADGEPLGGREIACVVNWLDLVSAGEDKALRDFFAGAAARRSEGCAGAAPSWRGTK